MQTQVQITYTDYRSLPETGPRYQVLDGDLVMSPAPDTRHQRLVFRVARLLQQFVEQRRLGEVLPAPTDVVLSETNVLQPDVLFVARRNRKRIEEEAVVGPPDLCIEVLSPKSRHLDLGIKRRLYARFGVREYWVVDPGDQTITVHNLAADPTGPGTTYYMGDTQKSQMLSGWRLDVSALFAD
jgi:Uma2 family endonuclease